MPVTDVYASEKNFFLALASEVRSAESSFCQQHNIPSYELMARAGKSLWEIIQKQYPQANDFLVITGPGNNAGDGFEVARLLIQAGHQVRLRFVSKFITAEDYIQSINEDAKIALTALLETPISIQAFAEEDCRQADLIIDGILGSGIQAPAREEFVAAIKIINSAKKKVLCIDIPSGLEADTGCEIGCSIEADSTLSFIAVKAGLVTAAGKQCCGVLYLDELGVDMDPSQLKQQPQLVSLKTEIEKTDRTLLRRNANSHKGTHGRTLVIGGNHGMGGAALLSASAAYRSGSGAVMLLTRSENISAALEQNPEVMTIASDDLADTDMIEIALQAFETASSIVIGPGLGKDSWAKFWLEEALSRDLPTVVDADALSLAKQLGFSLANTIITPHPGEAKALLGDYPKEVQRDRYHVALELQNLTQAIVVLKGAGSLITDAEQLTKVCPYGNPGMATAGMGDVLAGVIGSLLSQGFSKSTAATLGTLIHSLAGDRAASNQPIGLIASDLLVYIRKIRNEISGE